MPAANLFRMARDGHRLVQYAERLTVLRAVFSIATVAIALTVGAAALARLVEPETFDTFGEACWWALQTVSTVGYGDTVPESAGGRWIAGRADAPRRRVRPRHHVDRRRGPRRPAPAAHRRAGRAASWRSPSASSVSSAGSRPGRTRAVTDD